MVKIGASGLDINQQLGIRPQQTSTTVSYSPEQQEALNQQQETIAYLDNKIAEIKSAMANLEAERDRLTQIGDFKTKRELGIQKNALNAQLFEANKLRQQAEQYVFSVGEAENIIRTAGSEKERVERFNESQRTPTPQMSDSFASLVDGKAVVGKGGSIIASSSVVPTIGGKVIEDRTGIIPMSDEFIGGGKILSTQPSGYSIKQTSITKMSDAIIKPSEKERGNIFVDATYGLIESKPLQWLQNYVESGKLTKLLPMSPSAAILEGTAKRKAPVGAVESLGLFAQSVFFSPAFATQSATKKAPSKQVAKQTAKEGSKKISLSAKELQKKLADQLDDALKAGKTTEVRTFFQESINKIKLLPKEQQGEALKGLSQIVQDLQLRGSLQLSATRSPSAGISFKNTFQAERALTVGLDLKVFRPVIPSGENIILPSQQRSAGAIVGSFATASRTNLKDISRSSSALFQPTKSAQKMSDAFATKMVQPTAQIPRSGTTQAVIPSFTQPLQQIPRLATPFSIGVFRPTNFFGGATLSGGASGRRSKPFFSRGRSFFGRVSRRPSLAAIGLGIKAGKPARGEISGIVTRPIIGKPTKKKKKKKSKYGFLI